MTREEKSLLLIKNFEPKAGYYVAFSGGKDSIVILDLVRRAGVKYDAHYSITTIDPPELTKFIKKNYPEIKRERPEKNMFELVIEKKSLPTRLRRFCCEKLKETGGENRIVVLGLRWQESTARNQRNFVEYDATNKKIRFSPILDWGEKQVWDYIKKRKLPYPSLYQKRRRIGCVACPLAGGKTMRRELEEYPHVKKGYMKAIKQAMAEGGFREFESPEAVLEWWVSELKVSDYLEDKRTTINIFEGSGEEE